MNNETITTEQGHEYIFTRTTNDVNGNPRYIISWLNLGLEGYQASKLTRQAGLSIYRGKSYGGGFVVNSHSLQATARHFEKLGLFNS